MPSLQVELEFSSIGPINPATIMLLLQLNTALSKISEVLPLLDEHCGESTLLKSILGALQASASGWRAESNAGDRMDTDSTPDSEAESREPRSCSVGYSSVDSSYSSDGDSDGSETALQRIQKVSKNGLFEPFLYKNEHFTKTGSGQT